MKKILLSLTAAAALAAAAAPAAAQTWRQDDYGQRQYSQDSYGRDNYGRDNYGQRSHAGQRNSGYVDGLEWKINVAAREGRISRGEARQLLLELRQVQPLAWKVQTGRANGWERQRLDRTLIRIERAVSGYARNGRGDRDYGYGEQYRR